MDMVQTDEIKIRLTAFWVFILAVLYWITRAPAIPLLLVIDFGLRSFGLPKWSPLFRLSSVIAQIFKWYGKPVYMPAKRFAARVGFVFCITILVLHLFGISASIPTAIIILFAALESFAGFCAGCYVYDILQKLQQ